MDLRWRVAWAEDRAPRRHDLSAVPGTKTEEGRQEAAPYSTFGIGTKALNRFYSFFSQLLANAANRKFHFTLNHYTLHIENQGFNRQKNSGLNLEHVFSTDPERLKAYYYLLQIAHIVLQILEVGSLLRNVAAEFGRTPMQLFGSLKNLARRLLEAFRYIALSDEVFDHSRAGNIQIRFDTS